MTMFIVMDTKKDTVVDLYASRKDAEAFVMRESLSDVKTVDAFALASGRHAVTSPSVPFLSYAEWFSQCGHEKFTRYAIIEKEVK